MIFLLFEKLFLSKLSNVMDILWMSMLLSKKVIPCSNCLSIVFVWVDCRVLLRCVQPLWRLYRGIVTGTTLINLVMFWYVCSRDWPTHEVRVPLVRAARPSSGTLPPFLRTCARRLPGAPAPASKERRSWPNRPGTGRAPGRCGATRPPGCSGTPRSSRDTPGSRTCLWRRGRRWVPAGSRARSRTPRPGCAPWRRWRRRPAPARPPWSAYRSATSTCWTEPPGATRPRSLSVSI